MADNRKPLSSYVAPAYWPAWLGLGLLRVICWLPHRLALGIGRYIGKAGYQVAGKRRAIVKRNLELCFPDMPVAERNALVRQHFEALGISLIEMGIARWASDQHLAELTDIIGMEHLQRALAGGKGVILLSAHFTTLEISGRALKLNVPRIDAVYRKNRSPFITEILLTGRERSVENTIEKRDIKGMVRCAHNRNINTGAPRQSVGDSFLSGKTAGWTICAEDLAASD
jgi:KDO2-lipid IV(A) lauroyltransferase